MARLGEEVATVGQKCQPEGQEGSQQEPDPYRMFTLQPLPEPRRCVAKRDRDEGEEEVPENPTDRTVHPVQGSSPSSSARRRRRSRKRRAADRNRRRTHAGCGELRARVTWVSPLPKGANWTIRPMFRSARCGVRLIAHRV